MVGRTMKLSDYLIEAVAKRTTGKYFKGYISKGMIMSDFIKYLESNGIKKKNWGVKTIQEIVFNATGQWYIVLSSSLSNTSMLYVTRGDGTAYGFHFAGTGNYGPANYILYGAGLYGVGPKSLYRIEADGYRDFNEVVEKFNSDIA
jgi:hypothetical protein